MSTGLFNPPTFKNPKPVILMGSCRNSAFSFMLSVNYNKTFNFSLWTTKLAFCKKNLFIHFFAQIFLDTWRSTSYSMCRIVFITCPLGLCSSSDNLWGLRRPLDGFILRKGEQKKIILQSGFSSGSFSSVFFQPECPRSNVSYVYPFWYRGLLYSLLPVTTLMALVLGINLASRGYCTHWHMHR